MEVPVYSFFHGDFNYVDFFASQHYFHVVEEVPEECLFDPTEAPYYERDVITQVFSI